MIIIEQYILLPLEQRQKHLKLGGPCIERGGDPLYTSVHVRGLLADLFDTTIPKGFKIYACHACNNSNCSNVFHCYWGTAIENRADGKANGMGNVWENMIRKYGEEEARRLCRVSGSLAGKVGGRLSGISRRKKSGLDADTVGRSGL